MAENGGNQRINKRVRVVELKLKGLTAADVADRMRGEGYRKVSERTVERLWAEVRDEEPGYSWSGDMIDELLRQQLAEITIVDQRSLKLKYRDRLLDKVMPRQTQPIAITGHVAPIFDLGLKDVGSKPPSDP
ncbi:MAG: hypothetical protein LUO93_06060 [Methanomicrobiales archaeon]|nr:hypothetical protein [Methanomicrobiales archaeon]